MEADDCVGEVGVETHSGSKGDRHVGKKTHAEGSQGGDGGGSSDEVTLDDCFTEEVLFVGDTQVSNVSRADASTASISQDGS